MYLSLSPLQKNKAEMFLEIIGFQVEIKEKHNQEWDNATVVYFPKGNHEFLSLWQHDLQLHWCNHIEKAKTYSERKNILRWKFSSVLL